MEKSHSLYQTRILQIIIFWGGRGGPHAPHFVILLSELGGCDIRIDEPRRKTCLVVGCVF